MQTNIYKVGGEVFKIRPFPRGISYYQFSLYSQDDDEQNPKNRWQNEIELTRFFRTVISLNLKRSCGVQFIVIRRVPELPADVLLFDRELDKVRGQFYTIPVNGDCTRFSPADSADKAVNWLKAASDANCPINPPWLIII